MIGVHVWHFRFELNLFQSWLQDLSGVARRVLLFALFLYSCFASAAGENAILHLVVKGTNMYAHRTQVLFVVECTFALVFVCSLTFARCE